MSTNSSMKRAQEEKAVAAYTISPTILAIAKRVNKGIPGAELKLLGLYKELAGAVAADDSLFNADGKIKTGVQHDLLAEHANIHAAELSYIIKAYRVNRAGTVKATTFRAVKAIAYPEPSPTSTTSTTSPKGTTSTTSPKGTTSTTSPKGTTSTTSPKGTTSTTSPKVDHISDLVPEIDTDEIQTADDILKALSKCIRPILNKGIASGLVTPDDFKASITSIIDDVVNCIVKED